MSIGYGNQGLQYRPDQLPAPVGYGSMGSLRAPIDAGHAYGQDELRIQRPMEPERVEQEFRELPQPQVPELLKVHYGKGDRNVVADLVRLVQGEDAQNLTMTTPEMARTYLESWGYPINANDWSGDEWQAAVEAAAMEFNPLSMLTTGYR